jgi:hypothetical protein
MRQASRGLQPAAIHSFNWVVFSSTGEAASDIDVLLHAQWHDCVGGVILAYI